VGGGLEEVVEEGRGEEGEERERRSQEGWRESSLFRTRMLMAVL